MKDRIRGIKLIMVDTHRIQSSLSFGIKKTIRAPSKGAKVTRLKIGKFIYFPSLVCSISTTVAPLLRYGRYRLGQSQQQIVRHRFPHPPPFRASAFKRSSPIDQI
jgi:hypothetical protein